MFIPPYPPVILLFTDAVVLLMLSKILRRQNQGNKSILELISTN